MCDDLLILDEERDAAKVMKIKYSIDGLLKIMLIFINLLLLC
jgi:hypothetical protein